MRVVGIVSICNHNGARTVRFLTRVVSSDRRSSVADSVVHAYTWPCDVSGYTCTRLRSREVRGSRRRTRRRARRGRGRSRTPACPATATGSGSSPRRRRRPAFAAASAASARGGGGGGGARAEPGRDVERRVRRRLGVDPAEHVHVRQQRGGGSSPAPPTTTLPHVHAVLLLLLELSPV